MTEAHDFAPAPDDRGPEATKAIATVSVVMPAFNCRTIIESSLSPLLQMKRRGEVLEVIVVDDGSTDGTAEAAASIGATVISTDGPHGPGSARNRGVQDARGEILWFVDSDVIVKPDAGRRVRDALASREFAAVVGSYDDAPQAQNFFSQYKNLVHHHYHHNSRGEVSTFWAGCGAVWKSAFLSAGGFDARKYSRPSIEDIEFGYRLKAIGERIQVVPEIQGKHLKVWTIRNLLRTELRDRAIPWSLLLLNRGRLGDELNIGVSERLRALLAGLLLASLLAGAIGLVSWIAPAILLIMAFATNLKMVTLFQRRNGFMFALGGVLFHQVYYLYSAAAYCVCWFVVKCGRPFRVRFIGTTDQGASIASE